MTVTKYIVVASVLALGSGMAFANSVPNTDNNQHNFYVDPPNYPDSTGNTSDGTVVTDNSNPQLPDSPPAEPVGVTEEHYHSSCSPEVQQNNLAKAEGALLAATQKPEFAAAKKFKASMIYAQQFKNPNKRIAYYLAIVGAKNQQQVADLMGGEHTQIYVNNAKHNLQLSDDQAQTLVNDLTHALRGGLK